MAKQNAKPKSALGRATWKGQLRLSGDSLLTIGVKAYTSRIADTKLKTVHKSCDTPIKERKECPVCGPIESTDTGKAHEWHKGRFVSLTDEEVQSLAQTRDTIVEIDGYVHDVYLYPSYAKGKTYYLLPDGSENQEAYQTFMEALENLGFMAFCEVTFKSRSPVAIYPEDGILKLTTLEYAEKIKDAANYAAELLPLDIKAKHVKEAERLIKKGKPKKFSWDRYIDEKSRALEAMIDEKIASGDTTTPGVNVLDLGGVFSTKKKRAKHG